jgi:hypothetical protein
MLASCSEGERNLQTKNRNHFCKTLEIRKLKLGQAISQVSLGKRICPQISTVSWNIIAACSRDRRVCWGVAEGATNCESL